MKTPGACWIFPFGGEKNQTDPVSVLNPSLFKQLIHMAGNDTLITLFRSLADMEV